MEATSAHLPVHGIVLMYLYVQWFWVTRVSLHWLLLIIASQNMTAFHAAIQKGRYSKSSMLNTILQHHTGIGMTLSSTRSFGSPIYNFLVHVHK